MEGGDDGNGDAQTALAPARVGVLHWRRRQAKGAVRAVWSIWLEERGAGAAVVRATRAVWPGAWRSTLGPLRAARLRPVDLPGGRWVRVRNRLAGIDEADLALAQGVVRASAAALPRPTRRYLGREVAGEVVAVGVDVSLARIGDLVTLQGEAVSSCETLGLQPPCRPCAAGNAALCEHRALPWPGVGAGWSDEMIVHESQLFVMPDHLTDDQALLLEPASRAVRALLRQSPEPDHQTLILGGGALAQLTVAAARAIFPHVALAVAASLPHQAAALADLGAAVILPRERRALRRQAAELTNAQLFTRDGQIVLVGGFDLIIDCEGTRDSLDEALRLARSGATVIMAAGFPRPVTIDPSPLWFDEVSIVGIGGPGAEATPEDMEKSVGVRTSNFALAARLMRQQKLRVSPVVTHRLPAARWRQALRVASDPARHRATRVALTFDEKRG